MLEYLSISIVDEPEFWRAFNKLGGVYFIRNPRTDSIKIGYSRDPWKRLSTLQVGNSVRLEMIGLIAAEQQIERRIHFQLMEGRESGEWFADRGITTQWLMDATQGRPLCRTVWQFAATRQVFWSWDQKTKRHTKHVWDESTGNWAPRLPGGE